GMVQRYNLATRHKFFRLWYRTRCIQSCFLRRCANDKHSGNSTTSRRHVWGHSRVAFTSV
ncbi:uncharacterized protein METZ01_LOCUS292103, partial [marine metagenome]